MECPKCGMKVYETENVCAFCGEILKKQKIVNEPKIKEIDKKEYKIFNLLNSIFILSLIILMIFYMFEYSVGERIVYKSPIRSNRQAIIFLIAFINHYFLLEQPFEKYAIKEKIRTFLKRYIDIPNIFRSKHFQISKYVVCVVILILFWELYYAHYVLNDLKIVLENTEIEYIILPLYKFYSISYYLYVFTAYTPYIIYHYFNMSTKNEKLFGDNKNMRYVLLLIILAVVFLCMRFTEWVGSFI